MIFTILFRVTFYNLFSSPILPKCGEFRFEWYEYHQQWTTEVCAGHLIVQGGLLAYSHEFTIFTHSVSHRHVYISLGSQTGYWIIFTFAPISVPIFYKRIIVRVGLQKWFTWQKKVYTTLILVMTILALIWYFWPGPRFITILVGGLGGPKTHNGMLKCDWLI